MHDNEDTENYRSFVLRTTSANALIIIFSFSLAETQRLKRLVKCTLELPTCSRWPRTGMVSVWLCGVRHLWTLCRCMASIRTFLGLNTIQLFYCNCCWCFFDYGNIVKKYMPVLVHDPGCGATGRISLCCAQSPYTRASTIPKPICWEAI